MSIPELTPEELQYYASLELADPDEDALHVFLQGDAADPVPTVKPSTSPAALASSSSIDPPSRPSVLSAAAAARRRNSASAAAAGVATAASVPVTAATRRLRPGSGGGVTDVLAKTDLVGGVAGMADATLQTRVVELPGRELTSVTPIQCFLNATHLYLQHNEISSVEGLELLQHLHILVIHHNLLTSVQPLQKLDQLFYLDLSNNKLASLPALLDEELPCSSLRYLKLSGNPCHGSAGDSASASAGAGPSDKEGGSVAHEAYSSAIRAACPQLECLDDVRLGSDDEEEEEEESVDAMATRRAEAKAEEAEAVHRSPDNRNGSGNSSRRAHNTIEAARAAARARRGVDEGVHVAAPTSSSAESLTLVKAGSNEQRPVSALTLSTSSPAVAKQVTPLEHEEERLLQQLLHRTSDARQGSAALARESESSLPDEKDLDVAVRSMAEGDQPDAGDGVADARQLFQCLQYTQQVGQARQQRDLAAHWDDVSRVLQTAQGLQHDRRRRMHARLQADTPSYAETLQLLQKESYSKDLQRYRGNGAPSSPEKGAVVQQGSSTVPTVNEGAAASKKQKKSLSKESEKKGKYVPKPPPPRR